ncbi:MAG: hypothetical protein WC197_08275 [Candidatus Gastranaerophilaceae bacterium]|jgi:hypothetical protein
MLTAVKNVNNSYAVNFKGAPNNSPFVILPSDPKAREIYLHNNEEVAEGDFAEGYMSFTDLLAHRIVNFWKLVTQDPQVAKDAIGLESQIRKIVKDDVPGNKLNKTA